MTRAAYVLPVVAFLFLIGFVVNIVEGDESLANMIAQVAMIALSMGTFLFIRRETQVQARFDAWLHEHVDEVRAGTASYDGVSLTYATPVRCYYVVVSLMIVSLRIPVRVSIGRDIGMRAGCAVVTVLFGWWGIPWGPFWTIKALYQIVRGNPPTTTVGAIVEGEPQTAPPRAIAHS